MRLRQVLDNLLANVRTHCPPGTSCVVTVDKDEHDAVINVEDDGPGLGPEDTSRVFERFFRADASRSRLLGGAGLGLSIVASITKAHGGTVTVAGGSRGGTVFTVRLPLSGMPEPEDLESEASENADVGGAFTADS
jgi:two-component system OmpR family sensor kinase